MIITGRNLSRPILTALRYYFLHTKSIRETAIIYDISYGNLQNWVKRIKYYDAVDQLFGPE